MKLFLLLFCSYCCYKLRIYTYLKRLWAAASEDYLKCTSDAPVILNKDSTFLFSVSVVSTTIMNLSSVVRGSGFFPFAPGTSQLLRKNVIAIPCAAQSTVDSKVIGINAG